MTLFARLRCDVCKRFKRGDTRWFHLQERYDSETERLGVGISMDIDICSPTCLAQWVAGEKERRKGYAPGHRWEDWGHAGDWAVELEEG